MLFRGIVEKYTADLILLTKFKKIIDKIGKICAKYGDTSFSYGIFTSNQRELWCSFLFEIFHFTWSLGEALVEARSFDF